MKFETGWTLKKHISEHKQAVKRFDDILSPTLFNIHVNDMIAALESTDVEVPIIQNRATCYNYADDAALVAEKEADHKVLLDLLQEWCVRWRMFVKCR